MSFGDGDLHVIVAQLKTENARLKQQLDAMPGIVRCRDCEHATISTLGLCKYCEMWVLPDVDGYGCDSQVNLPLDFFCAYGKRKEGGDD